MDLLLRRHVWVVDLIGIIIGAALAGHATSTLIASALLPDRPPAPRAARLVRPPAVVADKSTERIVQRNVFCSNCNGPPLPERTRRALTLLAVMFAPSPGDPRWSVAIVRDNQAATTGPYGVGDPLGDATIAVIEDVRVILDAHGRREFLELLPQRPGARRTTAGAPGDGIRQIGANSFEVRRTVLDQFLAGGITPAWPRVVLQARDGEPAGFRLSGVAGNGPFAALGLASGDLLVEVNGRKLTTADAALAAVTAVRTANHVSLLVMRGGRLVRMDYAID